MNPHPAATHTSYGTLLPLTTFLILFMTTSCGVGAFLKSGTKAMDEVRRVAVEAQVTAQESRKTAGRVMWLAIGGAAGAAFTVGKTIRRLRRR